MSPRIVAYVIWPVSLAYLPYWNMVAGPDRALMFALAAGAIVGRTRAFPTDGSGFDLFDRVAFVRGITLAIAVGVVTLLTVTLAGATPLDAVRFGSAACQGAGWAVIWRAWRSLVRVA